MVLYIKTGIEHRKKLVEGPQKKAPISIVPKTYPGTVNSGYAIPQCRLITFSRGFCTVYFLFAHLSFP